LQDDKELFDRYTKPFREHLEDLRHALLWCVGSIAAGMLVAIPLAPWILALLKDSLASAGKDPETFLKVMRVTAGLAVTLRIVFWTGMVIAVPVVAFAVARFVFPGLKQIERRVVLQACGVAALLFAAGVAMGYTVTLPVALRVMFRVNSWLGVSCEFVELADYVGFAMKLLVAFGLAFELPVVVLALGSMGVVSADQLRRKRPYVIVGLLVLAMLLTPPDPFTQLLMAVPMALLYELCIVVIAVRQKRP